MKAKERRQQILTDLRLSQSPITANQFADKYQVSRQVIVGDIALLRAGYADILATNQGYVLAELAGPKNSTAYQGKIVCQHGPEQTEEELRIIIQDGGQIEDVQVDHPVYGILKASLKISSLADIEYFIQQMSDYQGEMLSSLTDGIHIHSLTTPTVEEFKQIKADLKAAGILYTR
ncbi:transcription repressor NadR [Ignavigranum ruoffiae]|uniref:transcription repressor NadR n=1 Tax=Ignavigranum ruoffiae TaxID=89093 RepID=UPI002047A81E|nr:transcription repressor NadR [Ignavigranum ruoffiae]UPQ86591.1 transcription repressor NadR [Ignavigranum ruoffiae]